jgi:LEA14-like dessication related protein
MKKSIFFLTVVFLISCTKKPTELIGIWEVQSPFYKARYAIEEHKDNVVAKIKYYNDDTYVYRESGTDKDIFLYKIQKKEDVYVDAISGATITKKEITLKLKSKDTLEVTTYIRNKPLKEFWIKKQVTYENH